MLFRFLLVAFWFHTELCNKIAVPVQVIKDHRDAAVAMHFEAVIRLNVVNDLGQEIGLKCLRIECGSILIWKGVIKG